jgi:hypothetical protein
VDEGEDVSGAGGSGVGAVGLGVWVGAGFVVQVVGAGPVEVVFEAVFAEAKELLALRVPFAPTSCNIFDVEGVAGVACFGGFTAIFGCDNSPLDVSFDINSAFALLAVFVLVDFSIFFDGFSPDIVGAFAAFVDAFLVVVFLTGVGFSTVNADSVSASTTFFGRPRLRTISVEDIVLEFY